MGKLKTIAIASIRPNPVALRTVNKESEDYLGLVDSIKLGWRGAISVRERKDETSGAPFYELIDGLHRYSAAIDAGLEEIGVDINNLDDDQVLEAQILMNIHKVETKPMEYSAQLRRILARNSSMTESELATKLGKSKIWIAERLNLNKIDNPTIKGLIDEGKIPLANAYLLSRLDAPGQAEFTDRAMTMGTEQFGGLVNDRVKAIKEAKRKGDDTPQAEFKPVPFMQKSAVLKDELSKLACGKELIAKIKPKTSEEVWALAIQWLFHMDPLSIQEQIAKDKERRDAAAAAKAARDAERIQKNAVKKDEEAKKAVEAAEKAKEDLAKLNNKSAPVAK